MKLGQKGFSLAEVMIAGGLMGLVALGAMHLMKSGAGLQKKGDLFEGNNRSLMELTKIVHKAQKAVSWDEFDYSESYYENSGDPQLVNWSIADVNWTDSKNKLAFEIDGLNFYKSSHLISIPLFNGKVGALFSRCVPVESSNQEYTAAEAYNLNKVPILKKSGKALVVTCCSKKSTKACSEVVKNDGANFRVKTFYYRNGKVKNYPLEADKRFIKGTGIFITFDKNKNPDSYKLVIFNQTDSCFYKDPKCVSHYMLKPKTLSFSLKTQGVQDRGFIEMN